MKAKTLLKFDLSDEESSIDYHTAMKGRQAFIILSELDNFIHNSQDELIDHEVLSEFFYSLLNNYKIDLDLIRETE